MLWFTGAVVATVTGTQPAPAVRWALLASELSASLLLAVTAWWGTRPRPATPTPAGAHAAAIITGVAVAGLAVLAAAVGKVHEVNVSNQILFATGVAVAFYAVVRSRPTTG